MNDNQSDPEFDKQLALYIKQERSKLDIKPSGMMGNWAFAVRKKDEFTKIWNEAKAKEKDDSFE